MSQRAPVRGCGDLRYTTDSLNCFIIFQFKSFMKFTLALGLMFLEDY